MRYKTLDDIGNTHVVLHMLLQGSMKNMDEILDKIGLNYARETFKRQINYDRHRQQIISA